MLAFALMRYARAEKGSFSFLAVALIFLYNSLRSLSMRGSSFLFVFSSSMVNLDMQIVIRKRLGYYVFSYLYLFES